ncbi:MAG: WbqC family protein [Bacteroidota bacterium]
MNTQVPILLELHYFPSIQYFSKFFLHPNCILEQRENYVKRSFRNRTHIATANGPLRLSIPLEKGKNNQQPIREVRISYDENWAAKQWNAIYSAYGNAPFFEYYVDDLRPLFQNKSTFLFEHNLKVLQTLFFVLDIKPAIQLSQTYLQGDYAGICDFRNKITPKDSSGENDNSFQITPYQQVFEEKTGFLPNLSILDLLFCKGPEAVSILEQSSVGNGK